MIEGTDGSGKGTQSKLLFKELRKKGYSVAFFDFPQYGKPSCALVEKYLNGKYGTAREVGPYRASIFYAVDRYDASFQLKKWLDKGKIVIANRYVASNLAHQGGKIENAKKRKKYYEWNNYLEHTLFDIPQPTINIILHIPPKISQKLVDKKKQRSYLKGKKRDIHESDLIHLKAASRTYMELARLYPKQYRIISCVKKNTLLKREQIAATVWDTVKKRIQ